MVSSNWDRVSLGDVCRVEAGAGFPIIHQGLKDQEFPFFKVGDMNTSGNEREMRVHEHSISEETRKKLRAIAFPAGTVVFPKIGAAIATNKKRLIVKPSCVDNNVMALIPSENLDSSFLFYLLLNKDLSDFANTGNPPSIRQSNVEEWVIPLPPLIEQKRIASLLARADRLRHLRRTAHDLGESLLQSVFLEMFGHVRVNDKKWELAKFEDVCESRLGKMLDDKKQTGKHKRQYLRNFNVQWFRFDLSDIAEMDFDEKDRKEFRLQYGDILMCEGGEVGRCAIWKNQIEECYFQKALHRVRPNLELVKSEYLVHLFWWLAQTGGLGDFTSQVTIAHLTGEKLKELVIPIPPLSLQEEFAGVVAQVESLRGRMSEGERQVDGLFESLLAESFGG